MSAGNTLRRELDEARARAGDAEERAARYEAEAAELRRKLRGAEMCDACAGEGNALGRPCGCGGTGLLVDMVAALRVALVTEERRSAQHERALRALVAATERRPICGVLNEDGSFCATELAVCPEHPDRAAAMAFAREALR